jgi:hypothetical protein
LYVKPAIEIDPVLEFGVLLGATSKVTVPGPPPFAALEIESMVIHEFKEFAFQEQPV